ncbi:MAG: response regulator [Chitinispirillia bacterium]|jgi:DNA-binding NtrC family response regulator
MSNLFNALVIDDDLNVRSTFKNTLQHLGCKVTESESAENGMSVLYSTNFNIVFAALCVKKIGARGVARWIKINHPNTKFIIITSWKGQLETAILSADGIHGVVHKPLLFTEIREILLEHLG